MFAPVRRFILDHDDSKAFIVVYIGLAVLLAIILGLFWLALIVGIHFLMEVYKQFDKDASFRPAIIRSLWELKLDIGLVLCGLVIGIYIDVLFGIAGLGHLARAGAQTATRASMWPRILRGVLLTLDDVALVAKGAAFKKKASEGIQDEYENCDNEIHLQHFEKNTLENGSQANDRKLDAQHKWGGWVKPRWSLGDRVSLAFTVANILLIVCAPLFTDHTFAELLADIMADLHPFPDN